MDPKKQGFLQAIGVGIYCLSVGLLMQNLNKILPGPDSTFSGAVFLLLFSASALICALIVFYKPYLLFFQNKKKEAIETVMFTAVGIFALAVVGFIGLVVLR